MDRPSTFAGYLELLTSWVGQLLPPWNEVLVEEEENGHKQSGSIPAANFETRFQEILRATTRSWVNLHAERVEGNVLYVVVGYITRQDSSAVKVPTGRISVNMSGPVARYRIQ